MNKDMCNLTSYKRERTRFNEMKFSMRIPKLVSKFKPIYTKFHKFEIEFLKNVT